MKKLIAAVTLILVFSIGANAQAKKAVTKDTKEKVEAPDSIFASQKDSGELAEFLGLNETEKNNFERLFKMKHEVLQDKAMSEERKAEMRRIVELKIRATLDGEQMEKLEKNPALFKKLIN